jgi:hypothetical protein
MIAIDPGASGGIAFKFGDVAGAFPMPDTDREIADVFIPNMFGTRFPIGMGETQRPRVAYLEDLIKFTGRNMPSSSMAVYAGNFGFIKGVLTALGYRIVLVHPKTWQKALSLGSAAGLTKTQWKNKLKQRAEELFPQIKVTLKTADALLILEAARRNLLG